MISACAGGSETRPRFSIRSTSTRPRSTTRLASSTARSGVVAARGARRAARGARRPRSRSNRLFFISARPCSTIRLVRRSCGGPTCFVASARRNPSRLAGTSRTVSRISRRSTALTSASSSTCTRISTRCTRACGTVRSTCRRCAPLALARATRGRVQARGAPCSPQRSGSRRWGRRSRPISCPSSCSRSRLSSPIASPTSRGSSARRAAP